MSKAPAVKKYHQQNNLDLVQGRGTTIKNT